MDLEIRGLEGELENKVLDCIDHSITNGQIHSCSTTEFPGVNHEKLKTELGKMVGDGLQNPINTSPIKLGQRTTVEKGSGDVRMEKEGLFSKPPPTQGLPYSISERDTTVLPLMTEDVTPDSEDYLNAMESTGVTFIDENGLEIIPRGVNFHHEDLEILQIKIEEEDPNSLWSSDETSSESDDSDTPEPLTKPKEPFICSYCGKHFNKKFNFQIHQLVHTGEKPFTCTECGKSFSQKRILQTHLKVHTGEKPFTCTECGKCFAQKIHLHTHLKVHTGEKPYTCTECGKCFSVKSNLRKHQVVHTGTKPFTCTECGKSFSEKGSLQRHLKVHTGEKPFKCTECGKGFTRKTHLSKHRKMHTGE